MSASLPEPSAQGDLERTPFAHALLYCEQHALTGTLVIWPPSGTETRGQDRIRFVSGMVVSARTTNDATSLETALLPLFARTAGPYAFYQDCDLVGTSERALNGSVDALKLISASLRGPSRDDFVDRIVGGFGEAQVKYRAGIDLHRFDLLPKEMGFIDVVRSGPSTIRELISISELTAQHSRRLLYLLILTKSLEPYTGRKSHGPAATTEGSASNRPSGPLSPRTTRPPERHVSTPAQVIAAASGRPVRISKRPSGSNMVQARRDSLPPVPSALGPELAIQWCEINDRAAEIENQNYFEMLGVDRSAPRAKIDEAYYTLVRRWHPDRLPAELAPLRIYVNQIFQHLTKAHATLSDEESRVQYEKNVREGGGTPESDDKLAGILQAAMDLQKAEVLIRKRDIDGAIALLRQAYELSPEDPAVPAALAWALFQQPGDQHLSEMKSAIDRSLDLHEGSDRAHYIHGLVLRRMGREREAVTAFARATEINPRNVEAMREVRLAKMRGIAPKAISTRTPRARRSTGAGIPASNGRSVSPPASPSLLGKFFGGTTKKK